MNIPDKALKAAANAMVRANPDLSGWDDLNQAEIDWYMRDAREALEAAVPFIAAQALHDAAARYEWEISMDQETPTALREWADELDQQ